MGSVWDSWLKVLKREISQKSLLTLLLQASSLKSSQLYVFLPQFLLLATYIGSFYLFPPKASSLLHPLKIRKFGYFYTEVMFLYFFFFFPFITCIFLKHERGLLVGVWISESGPLAVLIVSWEEKLFPRTKQFYCIPESCAKQGSHLFYSIPTKYGSACSSPA